MLAIWISFFSSFFTIAVYSWTRGIGARGFLQSFPANMDDDKMRILAWPTTTDVDSTNIVFGQWNGILIKFYHNFTYKYNQFSPHVIFHFPHSQMNFEWNYANGKQQHRTQIDITFHFLCSFVFAYVHKKPAPSPPPHVQIILMWFKYGAMQVCMKIMQI